jgi:hypothetical protein
MTMTLIERPPTSLDVDEALRLFERMCEGKRAHSAQIARKVATEMRWRHQPVSPYRCPFCHRFHVGHPASMRTIALVVRYIRFGVDG